ncbi:MAG: hypothetical protein FWE09_06050 [Treponema sp.]|nr:hypothetical protein [Treponema sp.]
MCWYCGSPITAREPFGRSLLCPDCGKDIRACRSCRFYRPGARGDCAEPNAEPPIDKERANFCDWFSLDRKFRGETAGLKGDAEKANARAASARAAFDDLFG